MGYPHGSEVTLALHRILEILCRRAKSNSSLPEPSGNGATTTARATNTSKNSSTPRYAPMKSMSPFFFTFFLQCVYGWDFGALEQAIETLIVKQTSYDGKLKIKFTPFPSANDLIIIRPTNSLSKLVSNMFIKVLLCVTLIYPFIWLFKRFHDRGGGVWKVCGGGYPLKVVLPLPREDGDQLPTFEEAAGSSSSAVVQARTYVIGEREGEWFRKWENTIRGAVLSRRQDGNPLEHPTDASYVNPCATLLDGYTD
jgi:hypothetical protein